LLEDGEGDYDNFGYDVISLVKYLMDIVVGNGQRKELIMPGDSLRTRFGNLLRR